jgi:hypothetical protein
MNFVIRFVNENGCRGAWFAPDFESARRLAQRLGWCGCTEVQIEPNT